MRRQRGSVLVGVLWCLALLAVIVVGSLYSSRMTLGAAKNFEDKAQAHYLALAGVEKAKALLFHEAAARKKAARNHSGDLYNAPESFRDIPFGRGHFRVIRQGSSEEGGQLIYGVRDEESRLNINSVGLEGLTRLRDMPPETAAAIIDWRDGDNAANPGGAEQDYYLTLKPPYLPRNKDIQTMREMLLIRGVTPALLLGEDLNANGLLDPEENDGDQSAPPDNRNGQLEAGWSGIFTVDSGVANRRANGEERVNVQTASEAELTSVSGITVEIAKAIVAFRGKQKLENIADLLDVAALAPERPGQANRSQPGAPNPGQPAPQNSGPPQTVGPKLISQDLLQTICDDVTAQEESTIKGAVNINTASAAALFCLGGMTEELAQAIVSHRQSAGYFANIAGLLGVPGMTPEIFKQLAPRISARSETFRIVAEGRVTSTGARERIEVVVRFSGKYLETISSRENL